MTFGIKLKTLRERKRLTQDELAELLQTTRNTIQAWENKGAIPRKATYFEKLSKIFKVPMVYLMNDKLELPETEITEERALIYVAINRIAELTAEVVLLKNELKKLKKNLPVTNHPAKRVPHDGQLMAARERELLIKGSREMVIAQAKEIVQLGRLVDWPFDN